MILDATDFEQSSSERDHRTSKSFRLEKNRKQLCIEEISNDQTPIQTDDNLAVDILPKESDLKQKDQEKFDQLSETINQEDKQQLFFTLCLQSF